jgi:serine/threonine protein phosphatase PrpC
MSGTIHFQTEVLSHPGGRSENQDFLGYLAIERFACWVAADGLGGHGGGAIAARTAVETILDSFKAGPAFSADALHAYLSSAHDRLRALQKQDARWAQMATTAVILLTDSRSALWAHIGDSRLYLFRAGRIEFQTEDHSVPQALCKAGDITPAQIRFHEDRNRLLRSLGASAKINPTVASAAHRLDAHDRFLLCTDGFWEYIRESEMEADLAESAGPKAWLLKMASRMGLDAGDGRDNYSAMAIFPRLAAHTEVT